MTRPKLITWPRFAVVLMLALAMLNIAAGDAFAAALTALVAGLYIDDALTGTP